ncbi:MAG: endo-1,4-beta-xylanase [Pyrinomonadaceae bacterium]
MTGLILALFPHFVSACKVTATSGDFDLRSRSKAARNQQALADASKNIEKYRKGGVRLIIIDGQGRPAAISKVRIKQATHDFAFGCYLKIDDLPPDKLQSYKNYFGRLFNYAVVGNYWNFVEGAEGVENTSWVDRETALALELGSRVQGAPVLWGTNEAGSPRWLPQTRSALLPILEKRVRSTVSRWTNAVGDWEIINEPLSPTEDVFAKVAGEDYISSAFTWARQSAPDKRLILNEYGVFGSIDTNNYNRDKYYQLARTLLEKGTPIDVIGIQAHAKGEWYEPANVADELNRYASLGKPLQITEFSAQTLDYDDRVTPAPIYGSYRSGVWSQEKQAEFYREFYTISFGNPQVEAIVTWGLDDERAWLPGIGLLDAAGNPKASYAMLDKLINQDWKTSVKGTTNNLGQLDFRGFFGKYQVEVETSSKQTKVFTFVLEKGKTNEWTVRLT